MPIAGPIAGSANVPARPRIFLGSYVEIAARTAALHMHKTHAQAARIARPGRNGQSMAPHCIRPVPESVEHPLPLPAGSGNMRYQLEICSRIARRWLMPRQPINAAGTSAPGTVTYSIPSGMPGLSRGGEQRIRRSAGRISNRDAPARRSDRRRWPAAASDRPSRIVIHVEQPHGHRPPGHRRQHVGSDAPVIEVQREHCDAEQDGRMPRSTCAAPRLADQRSRSPAPDAAAPDASDQQRAEGVSAEKPKLVSSTGK